MSRINQQLATVTRLSTWLPAGVAGASAVALVGLAPGMAAAVAAGALALTGLAASWWAGRSARQLQASSSLFYEVFRKYDAGNLLLSQAQAEVLARELELQRMKAVLKRMASLTLDVVDLRVPSPFSLPLMVERFREQLSTEKLEDRLARMLQAAQAALTGDADAARPDDAAESPATGRRPR